jgi:hypothetical protein
MRRPIRPRSVKYIDESVEMCDVVHTGKKFIKGTSDQNSTFSGYSGLVRANFLVFGVHGKFG